MLRKGVVVEKRIPTVWYFWRCPEKGCKQELKFTVEQFTLNAARQHQDKHQRDREKAERLVQKRHLLGMVN